MENELLKIIKKIKGSLLGIGMTESILLDAIEENDNIDTCYILSNVSLTGKKFNMIKKGRNKKINIKKLKKKFKKKSLDTVICNYDIIKQFYRSFVPNSIYINKGYLYIYGNKKDLENLSKKYQRYTKDIELLENKENYILKINNTNTKNKFFKDKIYRIKDFSIDAVDFITELLIN